MNDALSVGRWVRVQVPATSANLGPGFDSLGLALAMHDVIEARFTTGSRVQVSVSGEGSGEVPTDEQNLVAKVLRVGLSTFDPSGEAARKGLEVRCWNSIPHSRGLGSSAAAIVGGLVVAAALVFDEVDLTGITPGAHPAAPTQAQLVAMATWLEGHPDNVAAAILGGGTISWLVPGPDLDAADGQADVRAERSEVGRATRILVHPAISPVVMIPGTASPTSQARAALPAEVPHGDAAFNSGRAALLVHALTAEPRLLLPATADRLHQEQRRTQYPESMALVDALRARSIPAAVSGAGPTVIALAADLPGCISVAEVMKVMRESAPANARVEALDVATEGVQASAGTGR